MTIKKYKVEANYLDSVCVFLEVDHDKLTPELATLINSFWSNGEDRIDEEDGDVVRAVIRLFGLTAINYFLQQGGGNVMKDSDKYWTKHILESHEGWPRFEDLGIVITSLYAETPGYDDVTLTAM